MKKYAIILLLGMFSFQNCQKNDVAVSATGNGVGGSLARFTIANDVLYTVSNFDLNVFDLKIPEKPEKLKTINLGFGAETIFPYQNMLFIGTATGMKIFGNDTASDPKLLSTYTHIFSCDPVVAQGKYAYVTLRSGTNCRRGLNSLDVVDISKPENPMLISSTAMQNPYGLAVDGDNLFVCEGSYGLKSFDISDPTKPILRETLPNVVSYDVIPTQKRLIVTGQNGVYQYDYSNPKSMKLISKISLE